MIVKNEAPVIERCLRSVLPIIDDWLICDTGSTDGTQEIIRTFFVKHGKPGELHQRPWKDFAHNRSEALRLARVKADYTLIIDADDTLELSSDFKLPRLTLDSYSFDILHQQLRYPRTQLVRNTLPWIYEGVLHEFLARRDAKGDRIFPENRSHGPLPGVLIHMTEEGARRRQSQADRYSRDAAVLEAALTTETDPFLVARYTFYLAQSYRDAGEREKALALYLRRAQLGFWQQEVYVSLWAAGRLKVELNYPAEEIIEAFVSAAHADPERAEALHDAARYCRDRQRFQQGHDFASRAIDLRSPDGALFAEPWIYDYGALDEFVVNAYWAGRYEDAVKGCRLLLAPSSKLPESEKQRIEANLRFAVEAIEKRNSAADPEPPEAEPATVSRPSDQVTQTDPSPVAPANDQVNVVPANRIHVLGVAHTVPHVDYLVCAFTAKVLLFSDVIQPYGWHVVEYSNEGSSSSAREHIVILSAERLRTLSKRTSREEPMDADVNNQELQREFQHILVEKLKGRVRKGDIVCHVWGPNMEVYEAFPDCHHVELCVGYTASPGLPFRIYETSAWMHWHYGKAGHEDGNNYKWAIPSPIDTEIWKYCAAPGNYAVFLGRVTSRKGINTLVEIARRLPELPIHIYGPGDTSPWADAPANIVFKGPVFGQDRIEVVRRARCMLMPTVFIEPFGNSGVEAQLCGVPLIGTTFGAFQETVIDGVTGFRCNTLADWIEAIRVSATLDRRRIAEIARTRYSKNVIGQQYDRAFRQLADLSGRGWYAEQSHKFAHPSNATVNPAEEVAISSPRKPRIWLYMPYFGTLPNYFQLYLDSLARNQDCLSVILVTDIDLAGYRVPANLIRASMTLDEIRERAARLLAEEFGVSAAPDTLIKGPYKLCDYRVTYLRLFYDISQRLGLTDEDFVGWGDCDVIYGRFSDFLDLTDNYQIIGGYHGHLTAFRNIEPFRNLFRSIDGLSALLIDDKSHIVDEVAFRKPLLEFLEQRKYRMFYANRYLCDIVPQQFFGLFRHDHAQRPSNFFDAYNPDKDIEHVCCDREGRLSVAYKGGESRRAIYCHLQKRSVAVQPDGYENGYFIQENAFMPIDAVNQSPPDPALKAYLSEPGPHRLEVGAGWNVRDGWFSTDLDPPPGLPCMKLDATKRFEIPSDAFDYVYSEHMIEHVPFDDGLNMLEECYRILKPGGTIRICTPSLGFLSRVISSDRGLVEDQYRRWSVQTFVPNAPAVTNAFFLNNFVRNWGHKFIYDRETLELALQLAGFEKIIGCELNESAHPSLRGLANVEKIPPGFLDLESMVFEATKPVSTESSARGRIISTGKHATQSSISPWSREATPEADAGRVVSGTFTGSYNSHTNLDSPAWWRVDLDRVQQINEVHIYNRVDANPAIRARLSRLEIQVSDDDRNWHTAFRKETAVPLGGRHGRTPFIWKPDAAVSARFLRIQLLERQYLHLEQVEIFGP